MRKILLSVLAILLAVMTFLFIKDGIHIGSLNVPGITQIKELNDQLTVTISDVETEQKNYTAAQENLKSTVERLAQSKKAYLDLVTVSSEKNIQEATQTKTYRIEYLWRQVGKHATKNGVNLKMDVTASTSGSSEYKNLSFTVSGKYLPLVLFISDIEEDDSLNFVIDTFNMKKSSSNSDSGPIDVCTFTVKDVKIIKEDTNSSATGSAYSVDTTNNSTNNNNTNSTTTGSNVQSLTDDGSSLTDTIDNKSK